MHHKHIYSSIKCLMHSDIDQLKHWSQFDWQARFYNEAEINKFVAWSEVKNDKLTDQMETLILN